MDGSASKRYIERQRSEWPQTYPNGLPDAGKNIDKWFEGRKFMAHLTVHGVKDMHGHSVAQPNRIKSGGPWLVYNYKHPAMSDTRGRRAFFHGSLWYGVANVLKHNYICLPQL